MTKYLAQKAKQQPGGVTVGVSGGATVGTDQNPKTPATPSKRRGKGWASCTASRQRATVTENEEELEEAPGKNEVEAKLNMVLVKENERMQGELESL